MNSRRARNGVVSAALGVAFLFFHSAFFAQLAITVKTNPGEFVLTSVDAQFQGELNSNVNDRKPPSAGMPQPESWVGKKASLGVFFPSFRPGSSQG